MLTHSPSLRECTPTRNRLRYPSYFRGGGGGGGPTGSHRPGKGGCQRERESTDRNQCCPVLNVHFPHLSFVFLRKKTSGDSGKRQRVKRRIRLHANDKMLSPQGGGRSKESVAMTNERDQQDGGSSFSEEIGLKEKGVSYPPERMG